MMAIKAVCDLAHSHLLAPLGMKKGGQKPSFGILMWVNFPHLAMEPIIELAPPPKTLTTC